MYEIPVWCKVSKENYRVEVSQKGLLTNSTERDYDRFADDLNEFFSSHREWDGEVDAETQFDEVIRCRMCDDIYVPYYDLEREEEVCRCCRKGKLEWAIKILNDANEREKKANENIL
jgi:hypothetical protein